MIFLSQMMVTTILWVLISMLWGLFQGVKKSVGAIGSWKNVQPSMDVHHQQMILYTPFSNTARCSPTCGSWPCSTGSTCGTGT